MNTDKEQMKAAESRGAKRAALALILGVLTAFAAYFLFFKR